MNQKKNNGLKIAIVIVLIIILILIGVIALLYFATDVFRSNKEAFFKYTAQLIAQEDGFIDNTLTQYLEKKKNTPYEDNGSIDFDISIPEMGQDNDALNNFNISFTGKTDNTNSKNEQNISLNYSNDVNFPFYYRKVGDVQGIQTDNVGSKYIAKRDGEEIQSLEDMEININGLEEISAIYNNMQISNEDIQNFKTTYFDNIFSQIQDDKFSKISEENSTGYKLTLSDDDLKDVLTKVLEKLKEDEGTLDKLNQLLGLEQSASKIRSTSIDELINDITDGIVFCMSKGAIKSFDIKEITEFSEYLDINSINFLAYKYLLDNLKYIYKLFIKSDKFTDDDKAYMNNCIDRINLKLVEYLE